MAVGRLGTGKALVGNVSGNTSIPLKSAVDSEWTTFTPVLHATTTDPSLGTGATMEGRWRRIGDSMEISITIFFGTSPSAGSGTYYFLPPDGYSVDTTKLANDDAACLGNVYLRDNSSSSTYTGSVLWASAGFIFMVSQGVGNIGNAAPFTWATGDRISLSIVVPIQGWEPGGGWGAPLDSEWVEFTPQLTASTTDPVISNGELRAFWRREGDSMHVRYGMVFATGDTAGSGYYNFGLPPGYVLDTNKISYVINTLGLAVLGYGIVFDSDTAANRRTLCLVYESGEQGIIALVGINGYGVTESAPFTWADGDHLAVDFTVPIVGWTANGSGYVASELWMPPASPHQYDDEFWGDVLNSVWSAFHGYATPATLTTGVDSYDTTYTSGNIRYEINPSSRPSWLFLQSPADGTGTALVKSVTLPTNVLIVSRLKFSQDLVMADVNGAVGLFLAADSSSAPDINNSVTAFLNLGGSGVVQGKADITDGGSPSLSAVTTDVDAQGQALEYVAIHKIGTTYHVWVSNGSGNWINVGSATLADTIAWMGIRFYNTSTESHGVLVVAVDFIRLFETSAFLL